MRQITITLILSLLFISGFAQWQILGDNIYYNFGNVGIGTEIPDAKLHLKDDFSNTMLRIESSSMQSGIQLISNWNFKPFINFGTDGEAGSKGTIYYDVNFNQLTFRGCKIFDENKEMVLQDNGNVGIGTKSPAFKLDLNGDLNFTGDIYKNGQLLNPSCLWSQNGENIYYNSGNVGIGTEIADAKLHLKDDFNNALLRIESSSLQSGIQLISNENYKPFISFGTNGEPGTKGTIYYDVNFNQLTFRGCKIFDENKEMVLQDNGNVGIGTKSPAFKLDLNGDLNLTGDIYKNGQLLNPSCLWSQNGNNIYYNSGNVGIGTEIADAKLHLKDDFNNALLRIESSSLQSGIQLISNENYKPFISFGTNGEPGTKGTIYYDVNFNQLTFRGCKIFDENKEMVLQDNGNVGIGTKSPKAKLEVANGDIFISDINRGIIMKSPDGNCWRGQLDNTGNMSFTMIVCPDSGINAIETPEPLPTVAIFPNPTDNNLTIVINEFCNQSVNAEIFDILGKVIFAKSYSSSTFNIDTSDFQNGTYILKLLNSNGELLKTEKIIKK